MADDTRKTDPPAAPKLSPEKVPAGIEVQTGQAAAATVVAGAAETKASVEKAGFVLVKKNPHVVAIDVFETGDFKIGKTPVAVPADQVEAICGHKDEYGRQLVVRA
jgi:hypothetical protein